jgi:hypothetical protein
MLGTLQLRAKRHSRQGSGLYGLSGKSSLVLWRREFILRVSYPTGESPVCSFYVMGVLSYNFKSWA